MTRVVLEPVLRFESIEAFEALESDIKGRLIYGGGLADMTHLAPPSSPPEARYILHLFNDEIWELVPPGEGRGGHLTSLGDFFERPDQPPRT